MNPKLFIGPMSKNIIDSTIKFVEDTNITLGLIPSRRQIEYDRGYVNNWSTQEFCQYVKNKTNKILLVRDHSGPNQGNLEDDGIVSFDIDCNLFDVIHIDVWKKHKNLIDGIEQTAFFIKRGLQINSNLSFEIGTEESIRHFSENDLILLIEGLKERLTDFEFSKVKYLVIQSGTALTENVNIGTFNEKRLVNMCEISSKYGLISKEHNGDYLKKDVISKKFNLGLDSINIAPEFGNIETNIILSEINQNSLFFEQIFEICLKSEKWKKWVSADFDPLSNKRKIIEISAHYIFNDESFLQIKSKLSNNIDFKIKKAIVNRISELVSLTQNIRK